ncbi:ectonucleoside triphosphate diphosphohydrolase 1-like [Physella acuta]|uniref:ectonucleoside triphosphate diphosphohydrolase 1-like n=1 Tax=Physella acuta TaxID=109671 RepID=UPI0027DB3ADB|nr:ectonucleoside triphosphate diphosphohydrolase 1-like [Physella acuta]XP_059176422.1 ectonucleoside triphosphate diphosphohydrolase 1-like [Physella acuta]
MGGATRTDMMTSSSLCVLAASCLLLTLTYTCADTSVADVRYGVLLDAGSSSTKLKVYSWVLPSGKSGLPKIDLVNGKRSTFPPGLDDFKRNVTAIHGYMEQILSSAVSRVPPHLIADTPIFLMATAGLRYMTAEDANDLLQTTRSVLANSTLNPFLYDPSRISLLSGEEEGVFSWIAANYISGFFSAHAPNKSVGVLEMGGGSTQITFLPNGPLFSEEYQVTVAGKRYQLYVQSYLQYGSNGMKIKVADHLVAKSPGQKEIKNPCMLKGDHAVINLDGRRINQTGTSGPLDCLEILREILKPYTGNKCQPKPCAIGSVYQPSVEDIQFLATQVFQHAPNDLKAVGDNRLLNISHLEEMAIGHCNKSMQDISADKSRYASENCLMGLYIPTLLTTSYGFRRNTSNIRFAPKSSNIDWALGAMLVELSTTFSQDKSQYMVTCPPPSGHSKSDNSSPRHTAGCLVLFFSVLVLLV